MKYLILCIGLISMISCRSAKIAVYEVGAYVVAQIDLILKKNKSFFIDFKDLDEKPPKNYTFKGKWVEKGNNIRLIFALDKNGLPDIHALFDPSLDVNRTVKIIDNKTVEFKKSAKNIKIWGLTCEKKFEAN